MDAEQAARPADEQLGRRDVQDDVEQTAGGHDDEEAGHPGRSCPDDGEGEDERTPERQRDDEWRAPSPCRSARAPPTTLVTDVPTTVAATSRPSSALERPRNALHVEGGDRPRAPEHAEEGEAEAHVQHEGAVWSEPGVTLGVLTPKVTAHS